MNERDPEAEHGRRDELRVVFRDVGPLQLIVAGLMLVPLLVSVLYREWYTALSLLASSGVAAAVGGALYRVDRSAPEPARYRTMLIAAVGWLLVALLSSSPPT